MASLLLPLLPQHQTLPFVLRTVDFTEGQNGEGHAASKATPASTSAAATIDALNHAGGQHGRVLQAKPHPRFAPHYSTAEAHAQTAGHARISSPRHAVSTTLPWPKARPAAARPLPSRPSIVKAIGRPSTARTLGSNRCRNTYGAYHQRENYPDGKGGLVSMCKDDNYGWSYVSNIHHCAPPPSASWLAARNASTWDDYANKQRYGSDSTFPPPGSVAWKMFGMMRTGTNFLEDFIGLNFPDAPPFLSSSDCIAPSHIGQVTNPWYWKHAVWTDGTDYLSQLVHQANQKYGRKHVNERFWCVTRDGAARDIIRGNLDHSSQAPNLTLYRRSCQSLKWPALNGEAGIGQRLGIWDALLGHTTIFAARPRYIIVTKAPYAFLISMLQAEKHWRTMTTVKDQEKKELEWLAKEAREKKKKGDKANTTLEAHTGVVVRTKLAPGQKEAERARSDGMVHAQLYSKFLRGWLNTWHALSSTPDEQGRIVFVPYEWALQDPESLTAYLSVALRFPRKIYPPDVVARRKSNNQCLAEMPTANRMSPQDSVNASRHKYIVGRSYLVDTMFNGSYRAIFDPSFDRTAIEELGYDFETDTFAASRAVYLPDSMRPLARRTGDTTFHDCTLVPNGPPAKSTATAAAKPPKLPAKVTAPSRANSSTASGTTQAGATTSATPRVTPLSNASTTTKSAAADLLMRQRLKRLKLMHDEGLIPEAEYNRRVRATLDQTLGPSEAATWKHGGARTFG